MYPALTTVSGKVFLASSLTSVFRETFKLEEYEVWNSPSVSDMDDTLALVSDKSFKEFSIDLSGKSVSIFLEK